MASTALSTIEILALKVRIIEQLHTCFDSEILANIYEFGLIYDVTVAPSGTVDITMTLTAPGCPAAGYLPRKVEAKVAAIPGVTGVKIEVVWDPPRDPSKMSEAARLEPDMP
jgi:FeS assembly SUF system protein